VIEREARLKEFLVAGLAGDGAAYHAFLRELTTHLRAFLRKRLAGLPDEVEDLVQETLLAVHNQRHTYDSRQPVTVWLHAIAKYKLIDLLRRRERRDLLTDRLDDRTEELFAAEEGAAHEARRDLARLLDQLPERQRLSIRYTKLDGLSVAETARITRMSASAVKVAVHRGLKALAARIRRAS
jgi:RNA polymerase sigma-70 factor (ECF subfamily)